MEFKFQHLKHFKDDFLQIAKQFGLNPERMQIEFYTPSQQVILIETVDEDDYKIHINLEEYRIISIQRVSKPVSSDLAPMKKKYRQYMT
jgi:hypothetical protein